MGLRVNRTKVLVYTLNGFCSALAGIALSIDVSSGHGLYAMGLELTVIGAVVIGGTLLSGGSGYVIGTLFGVLVIGVIQTLIQFNGSLSSWWTPIVVGGADAGVHRGPELPHGPSDQAGIVTPTDGAAAADRRSAPAGAGDVTRPAAAASAGSPPCSSPRWRSAPATTSSSHPRRAPGPRSTPKAGARCRRAIGPGEDGALRIDLAIENDTGAWSTIEAAEGAALGCAAADGSTTACPTVVVGTGGHRLPPGFRMRGFVGGHEGRAGGRDHPRRMPGRGQRVARREARDGHDLLDRRLQLLRRGRDADRADHRGRPRQGRGRPHLPGRHPGRRAHPAGLHADHGHQRRRPDARRRGPHRRTAWR